MRKQPFDIELWDENLVKRIKRVKIIVEYLPMLIIWRRRYFLQYHSSTTTFFEITNIARAK